MLVAASATCCGLWAQGNAAARKNARPLRARIDSGAPPKAVQRIATIHWQRVPLRDALARLRSLFDETVFVDRRVDPSMRVSLDIEAGSAEEVVATIASGKNLGRARLDLLVYLGPKRAADQLRAISAARSQEVGRLPADLRVSLTEEQAAEWPRLSEPRRLITSIVEQRGWRVANADAIPHDVWAAGKLSQLTLADQLTVLLVGFDLTFKLRPNDRSIEIIPLKGIVKTPSMNEPSRQVGAPPKPATEKKGARHVYTLRVQEQPVRAVLKELSKRLHWTIQIDEESIRAAGKSLDKRVSFSVENADQEQLLEALLGPAGLDYRSEDERVRIIATRYDEK